MSNDRAYCAFVITRTIRKHVARYRNVRPWTSSTNDSQPQFIHPAGSFMPCVLVAALTRKNTDRNRNYSLNIWQIYFARTYARTRLQECCCERTVSVWHLNSFFLRGTFTLCSFEFVLSLKVSSNVSIGSIRLYLITWYKWLLTTTIKIGEYYFNLLLGE